VYCMRGEMHPYAFDIIQIGNVKQMCSQPLFELSCGWRIFSAVNWRIFSTIIISQSSARRPHIYAI
jgi:hypothetical protein